MNDWPRIFGMEAKVRFTLPVYGFIEQIGELHEGEQAWQTRREIAMYDFNGHTFKIRAFGAMAKLPIWTVSPRLLVIKGLTLDPSRDLLQLHSKTGVSAQVLRSVPDSADIPRAAPAASLRLLEQAEVHDLSILEPAATRMFRVMNVTIAFHPSKELLF